jgi:hypothetical protein
MVVQVDVAGLGAGGLGAVHRLFWSLLRPWMRQPPLSGIRLHIHVHHVAGPTGVILPGSRLVFAEGSRNRRWLSSSPASCLVTVRRLIWNLSSVNS